MGHNRVVDTTPDQPQEGLRERKKTRTREAIQDHALRLYLAQGYDKTTVEQIAAAAEVSPSTFFRYFPTKEDTVVFDRLDPVAMEAFLRQPPELNVMQAMRRAIREVFENLSNEESELEMARQQLVMTSPQLRGRLFDVITEGLELLGTTVAKRLNVPMFDPRVLTVTGAVMGTIVSTYFGAHATGRDFLELLDQSLEHLELGVDW